MLKLIVIQPELRQRGKTADIRGQFVDLVIAQIEPLQFGQSRQRFGQRSDQVLAQLQGGQVLQTKKNNHSFIHPSINQKVSFLQSQAQHFARRSK